MVSSDAYQDEEVIRVVMKLLEDTGQRGREYEVLLRWQKLVVGMVPIRVLHCRSGDAEFFADVFDKDLKVFCPDFPVQKCAWLSNLKHSCSIM